MKYLRLRYTRFADMVEQHYLKAIAALALEDTESVRVFAGVIACVALFYCCWIVDRVITLVGHAAETVIAIIQ